MYKLFFLIKLVQSNEDIEFIDDDTDKNKRQRGNALKFNDYLKYKIGNKEEKKFFDFATYEYLSKIKERNFLQEERYQNFINEKKIITEYDNLKNKINLFLDELFNQPLYAYISLDSIYAFNYSLTKSVNNDLYIFQSYIEIRRSKYIFEVNILEHNYKKSGFNQYDRKIKFINDQNYTKEFYDKLKDILKNKYVNLISYLFDVKIKNTIKGEGFPKEFFNELLTSENKNISFKIEKTLNEILKEDKEKSIFV